MQENPVEECIVCIQEYQIEGDQRPFMLPCAHTCCKQCIDDLISQSKRENKTTFACPQCRKAFEIENFVYQQNYALINTIER